MGQVCVAFFEKSPPRWLGECNKCSVHDSCGYYAVSYADLAFEISSHNGKSSVVHRLFSICLVQPSSTTHTMNKTDRTSPACNKKQKQCGIARDLYTYSHCSCKQYLTHIICTQTWPEIGHNQHKIKKVISLVTPGLPEMIECRPGVEIFGRGSNELPPVEAGMHPKAWHATPWGAWVYWV